MGENFNIIYWILGIFALALTIRNTMQLKGYKRERIFANVYAKVLRQDEDSYEAIASYIDEEKDETLKNKARVIKVYEMLKKNENTDEIIGETVFNSLFNDKGRYNPKIANRNSDIFIWLTLVYARSYKLSKEDIIDKYNKKLETFDEALNNQLEYQLLKGVVVSLKKDNEEDYNFLNKLLDGDYVGMVYEQRLIGLYKRVAAAFIAYNNGQLDELFENDLCEFSTTLVGKCLMEDLGIAERYKKEENNDKSNEENTEEKTEEATEEVTETKE